MFDRPVYERDPGRYPNIGHNTHPYPVHRDIPERGTYGDPVISRANSYITPSQPIGQQNLGSQIPMSTPLVPPGFESGAHRERRTPERPNESQIGRIRDNDFQFMSEDQRRKLREDVKKEVSDSHIEIRLKNYFRARENFGYKLTAMQITHESFC